MLNTPFSPWPSYTEEEIAAVAGVLRSNRVNYWTGQECREFENEFADFAQCDHAIAVANGTVALDLALLAIELKPGDEVVVTSRTFIASVSSIINTGATPVFADVEPDSQNISARTIEAVITPKTRAVVCVHLAGWPCDMNEILVLAEKYNLRVIEDCAQAHGARYKGRPVGSLGDVAAWSFCQDKIMTTGGEGGMVTTNNPDLWALMWSFKDHGKSWDAVYSREHPPGFRWLHESFGTNWRMTEMQAAIGRIQLKRMNEWHKLRLRYANQIWDAARQNSAFRVPYFFCGDCDQSCTQFSGCEHAAYKCYVFVNGEESERDDLMALINASGVPCFSGSCSEVYLEKAFEDKGYRPAERLPGAKRLGETSLMFLCHPSLTQKEIDLTCAVLREVTLDG